MVRREEGTIGLPSYVVDPYTYNEIIQWAVKNRVSIYTPTRPVWAKEYEIYVLDNHEFFVLRWV